MTLVNVPKSIYHGRLWESSPAGKLALADVGRGEHSSVSFVYNRILQAGSQSRPPTRSKNRYGMTGDGRSCHVILCHEKIGQRIICHGVASSLTQLKCCAYGFSPHLGVRFFAVSLPLRRRSAPSATRCSDGLGMVIFRLDAGLAVLHIVVGFWRSLAPGLRFPRRSALHLGCIVRFWRRRARGNVWSGQRVGGLL